MRQRGFTLIEMLVVLVIAGLFIGLVVARGPSRSPGFLLRSEAQVLSGALSEARGRAIAIDHDVNVAISRNPPGLTITGRPDVLLPPKLTLTMLTADGNQNALSRRLVFHPDGGADGGGLLLANEAGRMAIAVAWLTGRISVAARPADAP
jgi:general secretion pathway protein H